MSDAFREWRASRPKEEVEGTVAPGTRVGDYRVRGLLGRGGSAEVYCAEHVLLGHAVAIKMLHRDTPEARRRFEREATLLTKVKHPGFAQFQGYGEFEGRPFIVMERLIAHSLPRDDRAVAAFLIKVLDALEALHRLGFVHRDVKPGNVLKRANGEPVLVDLGLACPMAAAARMRNRLSVVDGRPVGVGTPGYAAPEQMAGGDVTAATDVHGVGMLANECFGGKPPRCWRAIIDRATNSRPARRFQTVAQMAEAIRRRQRRRWWWVLWTLAGSGLLGVVFLWGWRHPAKTVVTTSPFLEFMRTATSAQRIEFSLDSTEKMLRNQLAHPELGTRPIPVVDFADPDHRRFFDLTPEIVSEYGPKVTNLYQRILQDHWAGRCGKPYWHNAFFIPRDIPVLNLPK